MLNHIMPNHGLSLERLKARREAELERMMEKNRRSSPEDKQKKRDSDDQAD